MGQSIIINFDSEDLTTARARSVTDLRKQDFSQFVAGDALSLDLFLTGSSGLLDIQSYSEVRVGIGNLSARPTNGTYSIDTTNTLNYNHTASDLETIIDSAVAAATVTELALFVFKIQFDDVGAQTIPAIDSRLLTPSSTVSVTKLVTGDATTKETWLWRVYQNPAAFTKTFTNISGSGIRGTLSLATSGIYDLLGSNSSVKTFFEVELTDSSGTVQTVLQARVSLNGEVIGHNFTGSIPVSPAIPPSATTFLESFPDPEIVGKLLVGGLNLSTGAINGYVLTSDATGDASWQPVGSVNWGSIGGTLSDQTDLQTDLDAKQDNLTFGIANTNAVKIDNTSAAANGGDICRFASTGIMPYKYADLKYDLGVDLKAPIDSPAFTGSAKVGTNSVSSSINSLAVGNQNTINGNFSLVVGILNTTHKSGNYALGDRNEVGHPTLSVGGNSTAIGSDNVLKGGNSFIAGNDNSLTEASTGNTNEFVSSSIIGNNNDISGSKRVFIIGTSNNITNADDAVAVGQNAVITGDNSIAVGTALRDFGDDNTVILGRFNDNPKSASKIVIGAGFSDTARYNAIEIESKGPLQKARSKMIFKSLFDTNSYADDTAAAAAGVELGELYRTDSVVKIRMS